MDIQRIRSDELFTHLKTGQEYFLLELWEFLNTYISQSYLLYLAAILGLNCVIVYLEIEQRRDRKMKL